MFGFKAADAVLKGMKKQDFIKVGSGQAKWRLKKYLDRHSFIAYCRHHCKQQFERKITNFDLKLNFS
jgi:hypothetical protein